MRWRGWLSGRAGSCCAGSRLALDGQAEGEVRLPQVTGTDGVRRPAPSGVMTVRW